MIIWGFKIYLTLVATGTYLCGACQNPAAQRLLRRRRKFTLFFIPLFPVSTKYYLDCSFCGTQTKVSKDDAGRIAAEMLGSAAPAATHQHPEMISPPTDPVS